MSCSIRVKTETESKFSSPHSKNVKGLGFGAIGHKYMGLFGDPFVSKTLDGGTGGGDGIGLFSEALPQSLAEKDKWLPLFTEEINLVEKFLALVNDAKQFYDDMMSSIDRDELHVVYQSFREQIINIDVGEVIFRVGGWRSPKESKNHIISYVIQKTSRKSYKFAICNAGSGIGRHEYSNEFFPKKRKIRPLIFHNVKEENLCNPATVYYLLNPFTSAEIWHEEKSVYEVFTGLLFDGEYKDLKQSLEFEEDPLAEFCSLQLAGTCFFKGVAKGLRYSARLLGMSIPQWKQMMFSVRYFSLKDLFLALTASPKIQNKEWDLGLRSEIVIIEICVRQVAMKALHEFHENRMTSERLAEVLVLTNGTKKMLEEQKDFERSAPHTLPPLLDDMTGIEQEKNLTHFEVDLKSFSPLSSEKKECYEGGLRKSKEVQFPDLLELDNDGKGPCTDFPSMAIVIEATLMACNQLEDFANSSTSFEFDIQKAVIINQLFEIILPSPRFQSASCPWTGEAAMAYYQDNEKRLSIQRALVDLVRHYLGAMITLPKSEENTMRCRIVVSSIFAAFDALVRCGHGEENGKIGFALGPILLKVAKKREMSHMPVCLESFLGSEYENYGHFFQSLDECSILSRKTLSLRHEVLKYFSEMYSASFGPENSAQKWTNTDQSLWFLHPQEPGKGTFSTTLQLESKHQRPYVDILELCAAKLDIDIHQDHPQIFDVEGLRKGRDVPSSFENLMKWSENIFEKIPELRMYRDMAFYWKLTCAPDDIIGNVLPMYEKRMHFESTKLIVSVCGTDGCECPHSSGAKVYVSVAAERCGHINLIPNGSSISSVDDAFIARALINDRSLPHQGPDGRPNEKDIALCPYLPSFGNTLNQIDSEMILSNMTSPYLRIPMVLSFFADNRCGTLFERSLQKLLSFCVFSPGAWCLDEPEVDSMTAIPYEESVFVATRFGLLQNELTYEPLKTVGLVESLLSQAISMCKNGLTSDNYVHLLQYLTYVAVGVEAQIFDSEEIMFSCQKLTGLIAEARALLLELLLSETTNENTVLKCRYHAYILFSMTNLKKLTADEVADLLGIMGYLNTWSTPDLQDPNRDNFIGLSKVTLSESFQRHRRKIVEFFAATSSDVRNKTLDRAAIIASSSSGEGTRNLPLGNNKWRPCTSVNGRDIVYENEAKTAEVNVLIGMVTFHKAVMTQVAPEIVSGCPEYKMLFGTEALHCVVNKDSECVSKFTCISGNNTYDLEFWNNIQFKDRNLSRLVEMQFRQNWQHPVSPEDRREMAIHVPMHMKENDLTEVEYLGHTFKYIGNTSMVQPLKQSEEDDSKDTLSSSSWRIVFYSSNLPHDHAEGVLVKRIKFFTSPTCEPASLISGGEIHFGAAEIEHPEYLPQHAFVDDDSDAFTRFVDGLASLGLTDIPGKPVAIQAFQLIGMNTIVDDSQMRFDLQYKSQDGTWRIAKSYHGILCEKGVQSFQINDTFFSQKGLNLSELQARTQEWALKALAPSIYEMAVDEMVCLSGNEERSFGLSKKKMDLPLYLSTTPSSSSDAIFLMRRESKQKFVDWYEVKVTRNSKVTNVYALYEHGRQPYRVQVWTSDHRYAIGDFKQCIQLNEESEFIPLPPRPPKHGGRIIKEESVTVEQRVVGTLVIRRKQMTEQFVPPFLLTGIIPSVLVDNFYFWAGANERDDFILVGEPQPSCHRIFIGETISICMIAEKEGKVEILRTSPDGRKHALVNLFDLTEVSPLFGVSRVMSRVENLSYVLCWKTLTADKTAQFFVQLPRLNASFVVKPEVVDSKVVFRLFSVEHNGWFISDDRSPSLLRIIRGFPHAVLLQNNTHEHAFWMPSVPLLRNNVVEIPFHNELVADRQNKTWNKSFQHKTFLYKIHSSHLDYTPPSLDAAWYAARIRLLSHEYEMAFKDFEKCQTDQLPHDTDQWMVMACAKEFKENKFPDAGACQLKAFIAAAFSGMKLPFVLKRRDEGAYTLYERGAYYISGGCRLTLDDEEFLFNSCFGNVGAGGSHLRVKSIRAARTGKVEPKLEIMLDRSFPMEVDLRSPPPYGYWENHKKLSWENVNDWEWDRGEFQFARSFSYSRPDLSSDKKVHDSITLFMKDTWLGHNGSLYNLGFCFLYEILTGAVKVKLGGVDVSKTLGHGLLATRFLYQCHSTNQDNSDGRQNILFMIFATIQTYPHLHWPPVPKTKKWFSGNFSDTSSEGYTFLIKILRMCTEIATSNPVQAEDCVYMFQYKKILPRKNSVNILPKAQEYCLRCPEVVNCVDTKNINVVTDPSLHGLCNGPLLQDVLDIKKYVKTQPLQSIANPGDIPFQDLSEISLGASEIGAAIQERFRDDSMLFAARNNSATKTVLKSHDPKNIAEIVKHTSNFLISERASITTLAAKIKTLCDTIPPNNVMLAMHKCSGQLKEVQMLDLIPLIMSTNMEKHLRHLNPSLNGKENQISQWVTEFMLRSSRCNLLNLILLSCNNIYSVFAELKLAPNDPIKLHDLNQICDSLAKLLCIERYYFDSYGNFDPRFLVFEFANEIILRKRQVEITKDILSVGTTRASAVWQMIMGAGKTTVIAPLICMILADGKNSLVQVAPPALLPFTLSVMRSRFSGIICRPIFKFVYNRSQPATATYSFEVYNRLIVSCTRRGITLTTPDALKSIMLKFAEMQLEMGKIIPSTKKTYFGGRQNLPDLMKIPGRLIKKVTLKIPSKTRDGKVPKWLMAKYMTFYVCTLKEQERGFGLKTTIAFRHSFPAKNTKSIGGGEIYYRVKLGLLSGPKGKHLEAGMVCEATIKEDGKGYCWDYSPHFDIAQRTLTMYIKMDRILRLCDFLDEGIFVEYQGEYNSKDCISVDVPGIHDPVPNSHILFPRKEDSSSSWKTSIAANERENYQVASYYLSKSIKLWRDQGLLLLDEVDLIMHPLRSELNFPVGAKTLINPNPTRWKLPCHIFDILFLALKKDFDNHTFGSAGASLVRLLSDAFAEGFASHDLQKTPHPVLLNSEFYFNRLKNIFAEWCFLWLIAEELDFQVSDDDQKHIINYLISGSTTEFVVSMSGTKTLQVLNMIRKWVNSFLPHTLSKVNRVSYGIVFPEDIGDVDVFNLPKNRRLLAIPFVGKDKPSEASEFAHPDIQIGFTILAYNYSGIRYFDMKNAIMELKGRLVKEHGPMSSRPSRVLFRTWLAIAKAHSNSPTTSWQTLNLEVVVPNDDAQMLLLHRTLRFTPQVIRFLLLSSVFPNCMMEQRFKLSASGQDLGSNILFKSRIGFSGTPSDLLPPAMKPCKFEPGSDGKVVHTLTSNKIVGFELKANWTTESILRDIATRTRNSCHALVDVGALINGMSNEEVARTLLKEGLHDFDACVYIDNTDQPMVIVRGNENKPMKLSAVGVPLYRRFTFYDEPHTTGIDIKQTHAARAIVTVSAKNTLRDISQGAWRMRGLGQGQTVVFFITDEVLKLIKDSFATKAPINYTIDTATIGKELIGWLILNEIKLADMQNVKLLEQNLMECFRSTAFEALIELYNVQTHHQNKIESMSTEAKKKKAKSICLTLKEPNKRGDFKWTGNYVIWSNLKIHQQPVYYCQLAGAFAVFDGERWGITHAVNHEHYEDFGSLMESVGRKALSLVRIHTRSEPFENKGKPSLCTFRSSKWKQFQITDGVNDLELRGLKEVDMKSRIVPVTNADLRGPGDCNGAQFLFDGCRITAMEHRHIDTKIHMLRSERTSIRLYSVTSSSVLDQSPKEWILYGRGSNYQWEIIDHQVNISFDREYEEKRFSIDEDQQTGWYDFLFHVVDVKNEVSGRCQFSMLQLYTDEDEGENKQPKDPFSDLQNELQAFHEEVNTDYKMAIPTSETLHTKFQKIANLWMQKLPSCTDKKSDIETILNAVKRHDDDVRRVKRENTINEEIELSREQEQEQEIEIEQEAEEEAEINVEYVQDVSDSRKWFVRDLIEGTENSFQFPLKTYSLYPKVIKSINVFPSYVSMSDNIVNRDFSPRGETRIPKALFLLEWVDKTNQHKYTGVSIGEAATLRKILHSNCDSIEYPLCLRSVATGSIVALSKAYKLMSKVSADSESALAIACIKFFNAAVYYTTSEMQELRSVLDQVPYEEKKQFFQIMLSVRRTFSADIWSTPVGHILKGKSLSDNAVSAAKLAENTLISKHMIESRSGTPNKRGGEEDPDEELSGHIIIGEIPSPIFCISFHSCGAPRIIPNSYEGRPLWVHGAQGYKFKPVLGPFGVHDDGVTEIQEGIDTVSGDYLNIFHGKADGIDLGKSWTMDMWVQCGKNYRALFENKEGSVLAAGKDYVTEGNVRHGGDSYIRSYRLSIGGERRILDGDKDGNLVGCIEEGYEAVGSMMPLLRDNLWHRLTVVGEKKTQAYYVDGKYLGKIDRQGTGKLCVLGGQNGRSWWGRLAQFQLFKVALSAEQIVSLPKQSPLGKNVEPDLETLPKPAIMIDFKDGQVTCPQDKFKGELIFITHTKREQVCPVVGPDGLYSAIDTLNGGGIKIKHGIQNGVNLGSSWSIDVFIKYFENDVTDDNVLTIIESFSSHRTLTCGADRDDKTGGDHQIFVERSGKVGMFRNGNHQNVNSVGCNDDGFYACGTSVLDVGKGWHRLTVVGVDCTQKFYVDGYLRGGMSYQSTSNVFLIGCSTVDKDMPFGQLAAFRLYDVALSEKQVLALFQTGFSSPVVQPPPPSTSTSSAVTSLGRQDVPEPSCQIEFRDGSPIISPNELDSRPLWVRPLKTKILSMVPGVNNAVMNALDFNSEWPIKLEVGENEEGVDLGVAWTISCWLKGPVDYKAKGAAILTRGAKRHDNPGDSYDNHIMFDDSGELGVYIHNKEKNSVGCDKNGFFGFGISADADFPEGVWKHLTVVGEGGATICYLDGTKCGGVSVQSSSNIYLIGGENPDRRWFGCVSTFKLFKTALTAKQVAALYQNDRVETSTPKLRGSGEGGGGLPSPLVSVDFENGACFISPEKIDGKVLSVAAIVASPSLLSAVDGPGGTGHGKTGVLLGEEDNTGVKIELRQDGRLGIDIGDEWTCDVWVKRETETISKVGLISGADFDTNMRYRMGSSQVFLQTELHMYGGAFDGVEANKGWCATENPRRGYKLTGIPIEFLPKGVWKRLTVVGEKHTQRYYIDGLYVGGVGSQSTSNIAWLGSNDGAWRWIGGIAAFRLFKVALTPEQVKQMTQGGGVGVPRMITSMKEDHEAMKFVRSINPTFCFSTLDDGSYMRIVTLSTPVMIDGELLRVEKSWDDDVVNTPFKDGALAFDSVLGVSFKLFHGETPGFDIGKKWSIDVWVKGPFCDQKGRCLKTFFRGIDRRTGPNQTGGDHQFQMANYDVGMWRNGGFGENLVGDDKDGFQSSGNTGRTFDTMVGTDWSRLTIVGSEGWQVIYVNGIEFGRTPSQSTSNIHWVGSYGKDQRFGKFSRFCIYKDIALTRSQVFHLHQMGIPEAGAGDRFVTPVTVEKNLEQSGEQDSIADVAVISRKSGCCNLM